MSCLARNSAWNPVRDVQHRLGLDKTEAYLRFHELMGKPEQTMVSGSVAEAIEHFMDWSEKKKHPKSCEWSHRYETRFQIGPGAG